MKIYVASSWRNVYQQSVVRLLRESRREHEVYDFKNPKPGDHGFHWSDIDPHWRRWNTDFLAERSFERYREALRHPIAEYGFKTDFDAMKAADACLLVMPCGRSAHLELGWCSGNGKKTAVLFPTNIESELPANHNASGICHECSHPRDETGEPCRLPSKLWTDFEAELMIKMADQMLIGREELIHWSENL